MMMVELECQLKKHDTSVNFDHKVNCVCCFAHIINICSSHLIMAMSHPSSQQPSYDFYGSDSDDESGGAGNVDSKDSKDDSNPFTVSRKSHPWDKGIKMNPLLHAHKLVHFLQASDQRKTFLQSVIKDGNEQSWFHRKDNEGNNVSGKLPQLQLLKDVKTRWDSVFLMLNRLIML